MAKRRPKFDEAQHREEIRARWAKAHLLLVDIVILALLVAAHIGLEKLIVWGLGGYPTAERILTGLTFVTILPCYGAICWEMVLLFWPSFSKRAGGES